MPTTIERLKKEVVICEREDRIFTSSGYHVLDNLKMKLASLGQDISDYFHSVFSFSVFYFEFRLVYQRFRYLGRDCLSKSIKETRQSDLQNYDSMTTVVVMHKKRRKNIEFDIHV